jgi:hypothetical protein
MTARNLQQQAIVDACTNDSLFPILVFAMLPHQPLLLIRKSKTCPLCVVGDSRSAPGERVFGLIKVSQARPGCQAGDGTERSTQLSNATTTTTIMRQRFQGETCCRSKGVGGGTHHNLVQPVEKVGTIPRVDFRRLEPGQTLEIGRGPFPDTSIVAVQRPSTRIHPGVCSTVHEFSKEIRPQCICMSMCEI